MGDTPQTLRGVRHHHPRCRAVMWAANVAEEVYANCTTIMDANYTHHGEGKTHRECCEYILSKECALCVPSSSRTISGYRTIRPPRPIRIEVGSHLAFDGECARHFDCGKNYRNNPANKLDMRRDDDDDVCVAEVESEVRAPFVVAHSSFVHS